MTSLSKITFSQMPLSSVSALNPQVYLEAVEEYCTMLAYRGDQPKTVDEVRWMLRRVAREIGSPIFSSHAIEARGAKRRQNGNHPRYLRKEEIVVEQFMRYLVDPTNGWIEPFIDAYGASPNQPYHALNKIMHVETEESGHNVRAAKNTEVRAFMARCDFIARNATSKREIRAALRDGAMYKTMGGLALRCMEISDARLSNCSTGPSGLPLSAVRIFGKAKKRGQKRPRTVVQIGLYRWVSPVLVHHVKHIMPLFSNGDGDRLFVNEDGRPLDPQYVSSRFRQIRNSAGLSDEVTAHSLRRYWATQCVVAGIDPIWVSKMLGHESLVTTQAYILPARDFIDRKAREYQDLLLESDVDS